MTNEFTIPQAGFGARPQGWAKRLILSLLIGVYSTVRKLARGSHDLFGAVLTVCRRVRGVHLLVMERIAPPPVRSVRLVELPAGSSTFKMALVTPGLIEDHLLRKGCWEPHLTEIMCALMSPKGVFVDIGANIGCHALHLAARYPESRCHAFEPHPEIFRQLTRNARLSSIQNLKASQCAIGRVSREGVFYAQGCRSYNRGLSSSTLQSDLKNDWEKTAVLYARLDEALCQADRRSVSLIKIDTQGSERDALAGAQLTIAEARPAVILEFESRYHADPQREAREILALLPGYDVFCLKPGSRELQQFHVEDVKNPRFEADLVCLPA